MSNRLENRPRDFDIANYLLIELVNVVIGLPLGLDVDRVVLNTFSCGHDQLSTDIKNRSRQSLQRMKGLKRQTYRMRGVEVGSGWGEGDGLVKKRLGAAVGVYKVGGGVEEGSYDDALQTRGNHMSLSATPPSPSQSTTTQ